MELSSLFHNITLSSGTGGCYLVPQDKNKNLSISYKNFNGVIKGGFYQFHFLFLA